MQDHKERDGKKEETTLFDKFSNLAFKTATISFSVSVINQPVQAFLTRLQLPSGVSSPLSAGCFRGLYRGFLPYMVSGQKRGALSVTSKQVNQESIKKEEGIETEQHIEQSIRYRYAGTFFFSQADLFLTSALCSKGMLENANIITKTNFHWSLYNYWKLTSVNWGSRSCAGFINFAALGFLGDYISTFYKFDKDFHNKLAGGATSGAIATVFTTLPNSYADRKLLASKIENGQLLTATSCTMFSTMKSHIKTVGTKEALKTFIMSHFLKQVLIRSPQSALIFGIIFGIDDLMGPEPLKSVFSRRNSV